jgi:dolichyl-phosphate beta-glucosyltransferase
MAEVPINWEEIAGSKVDIIFDSIRMARDLLLVRFLYLTGLWKISDRKV